MDQMGHDHVHFHVIFDLLPWAWYINDHVMNHHLGSAVAPAASMYFTEIGRYVNVGVANGGPATTCCPAAFREPLRREHNVRILSEYDFQMYALDAAERLVLQKVLHFIKSQRHDTGSRRNYEKKKRKRLEGRRRRRSENKEKDEEKK